jgi:hypothetical protein
MGATESVDRSGGLAAEVFAQHAWNNVFAEEPEMSRSDGPGGAAGSLSHDEVIARLCAIRARHRFLRRTASGAWEACFVALRNEPLWSRSALELALRQYPALFAIAEAGEGKQSVFAPTSTLVPPTRITTLNAPAASIVMEDSSGSVDVKGGSATITASVTPAPPAVMSSVCSLNSPCFPHTNRRRYDFTRRRRPHSTGAT